jgi:hypothetical protein
MPVIQPEVVLLESPAVLARLLSTWQAPVDREAVGSSRESSPPTDGIQRRRAYRSRPCSCGTCSRCQDNARWNKVFDEKFADPSYYGRISVRHNSSLAGL